MVRRVHKLLVVLMTIAAMVFVASSAAAEESVTVEVRAIAAGDDEKQVDDELADIENRLQRGFSDYSSFRHIEQSEQTIERGDDATFELPTDEDRLTLSYHGRTDEFVKLGLDLENRLTTTLRATPGSTFFQAGLTYNDSTLVLAITVE